MAMDAGGSGGQSNAVRAGGAFVELFTKDNTAQGLNAAKQNLNQFAASASATMQRAKKSMSMEQGFEKTQSLIFKSVAAIGLLKGGIDALNSQSLEKFNEGLERSVQLTDKLLAAEKRRRDQAVAAAGEGNNAQRVQQLRQFEAAQKNEGADLAGVLARARDRLEAVKKDQSILGGLGSVRDLPFFFKGADMELAAAKAAVDDAQKMYDAAKDAALNAGDLAKEAEKFEAKQAKFFRMDDAVRFHEVMAQIGQVELGAGAEKAKLFQDLQMQTQAAWDSLRGSFAGGFGGGGRGAFDFATGQRERNVVDEVKRQTGIQERLLEIDKKMADDIAEIRRTNSDVFEE